MRPDGHRRKWDRDEFEKLAKERLEEEEEADASTSKGPKKRTSSNDFDNLVSILDNIDIISI